MAAAPVAAQAAPARAPAPVAGDSEDLRGKWYIPVGVFIALSVILVLLFNDDDNATSP
ncbi:MAG TPA: hypothetical protein VEB68_08410 [Croceibacterium sp.]|nr:hypothetical protein [Croceibacterium sp.]